jgi:hypothetical protein
MPASAWGAMSVGSTPSGSGMTARSLVWRYSANPPSVVRPLNALFSQYMSSPSRQGRQVPQVWTGWQMTGSPSATSVTSSPTSATTPAFSWPSVIGRSCGAYSAHIPSMMWLSV